MSDLPPPPKIGKFVTIPALEKTLKTHPNNEAILERIKQKRKELDEKMGKAETDPALMAMDLVLKKYADFIRTSYTDGRPGKANFESNLNSFLRAIGLLTHMGTGDLITGETQISKGFLRPSLQNMSLPVGENAMKILEQIREGGWDLALSVNELGCSSDVMAILQEAVGANPPEQTPNESGGTMLRLDVIQTSESPQPESLGYFTITNSPGESPAIEYILPLQQAMGEVVGRM